MKAKDEQRWTNRQTDRQTDRQMDTGRQTDLVSDILPAGAPQSFGADGLPHN